MSSVSIPRLHSSNFEIEAITGVSTLAVDTISEMSTGNGVSIDGVVFKDNGMTMLASSSLKADVIAETTATTGVTIDGVLFKDSGCTMLAGTAFNAFYDTDTMIEDSATGTASQQSIKVYTDNHSYFHATQSGILNVCGAPGTTYTIVYDAEIHDLGGNFLTSTYTVPSTGYYHFELHINIDQIVFANNTLATATILANAVPYTAVTTPSVNGNLAMHVSVDLLMTAAQTITTTILIGGTGTDIVDIGDARFFGYKLGN